MLLRDETTSPYWHRLQVQGGSPPAPTPTPLQVRCICPCRCDVRSRESIRFCPGCHGSYLWGRGHCGEQLRGAEREAADGNYCRGVGGGAEDQPELCLPFPAARGAPHAAPGGAASSMCPPPLLSWAPLVSPPSCSPPGPLLGQAQAAGTGTSCRRIPHSCCTAPTDVLCNQVAERLFHRPPEENGVRVASTPPAFHSWCSCVAGYAAYHASKGGVSSLTRAAAIGLLADNIRVNAVCPGTTLTPGLVQVSCFSALSLPSVAGWSAHAMHSSSV